MKLCAISVCFYLPELFDWNSCLEFFLKRNQTDFLINKGLSCHFEKFNRKLRINFLKIVTDKICELLVVNLDKKSKKFGALSSYKNFFSNVNRKVVYLMLESKEALLKQEFTASLANKICSKSQKFFECCSVTKW